MRIVHMHNCVIIIEHGRLVFEQNIEHNKLEKRNAGKKNRRKSKIDLSLTKSN